ncbi:MAG: FAD binding domain-containing protein, partial [Dehalococcoidia bacterium]|nr:FAD binding domain-containing protein [Dehalococcoidia bacterium]
NSERTIPVEEFFTGPSQTVLGCGEILAEIQIPDSSLCNSGVYIKHSIRQAMDLAIVGVAVALTIRDGICHDARIALGAVAPTPVRAIVAETMLRGKSKDDSLFRAVAAQAARECQPITDIRSSAEYRREMVEVLTRRALEQAWNRCMNVGV